MPALLGFRVKRQEPLRQRIAELGGILKRPHADNQLHGEEEAEQVFGDPGCCFARLT